MSCTNPNCNAGCGCNNCCPPVTPPTPPTPPTCVGTNCEEIYDAACVNYTGPALTCFNIPTDTNLNSVIQTLATNICACCTKSKCINPFKLFFERFKSIFDALYAADNTIIFKEVFRQFLNNGLIVKKCQYCCPDEYIYVLGCSTTLHDYVKEYYTTLPDDIETPCVNCWTKYKNCATTLLTKFDPTLGDTIPALTTDTIFEYGGINNISAICDLNVIFTDLFTTSQITNIMEVIYGYGLALHCDLKKGNIVISGFQTITDYISNVII